MPASGSDYWPVLHRCVVLPRLQNEIVLQKTWKIFQPVEGGNSAPCCTGVCSSCAWVLTVNWVWVEPRLQAVNPLWCLEHSMVQLMGCKKQVFKYTKLVPGLVSESDFASVFGFSLLKHQFLALEEISSLAFALSQAKAKNHFTSLYIVMWTVEDCDCIINSS